MKFKKGDEVIVLAGKDKGRKGRVIRVLPKEGLLVVEGMNLHKKHVKPRRQGEKGQVVEVSSPMPVSNVAVFSPKLQRGGRVGWRTSSEGKKERVIRQTGEVL